MQSVCLDEFGGEKAVPPNLQETTLIQHIFGGQLQSEVRCLVRLQSKFSGLSGHPFIFLCNEGIDT